MHANNGDNRNRRRGFRTLVGIPLLVLLTGGLGCDPGELEVLQDIAEGIGDTGVLSGDSGGDTERGEETPTDELSTEEMPMEEMPTEALVPMDSATLGVEGRDGGEDSETVADASPQEAIPEICMCECPCEPEGGAGETETSAPSQPAEFSSDTDATLTTSMAEGCLIISEIVEGSSMNKGVELYNCGDAPLDLSTYSLCLYSNDATECGTTFALSGSVAAGEVVTICHSSAEAIPHCDLLSGVTNFSGDDRLALSNAIGVVDAFGELLGRPAETPWANVTLRRCNPAPYLGDTPFVTEGYFTSHEMDDFSDFGLPPTAWSCVP